MLAAMFRSTLLIVLLMLGGCHQIEPAPPPLRPRNSAPEVGFGAKGAEGDPKPQMFNQGVQPASSASESRHDHAAGEHAPPGAIVPRVAVEEVEPGQEALAQAILAASKPSMAECRANSGGGMIRLRVVATKSSAKITIDPRSTVSDKVRVCVLEALSTIDVPDTLSRGSPSMSPSAGFSSIISVNW